MKKKYVLAGLLITIPINACRNTISNNTDITFKVAEITQDNADLKQQLVLPEEYVKSEEKARTLKPGEETDFGGHYLPKFIIYRQDVNNKWRPLLYVKQTRCAPKGADPSRFPENKYLLITDLLKQDLPGDYQEVYSFTVKCEPSQLLAESANEETLTKIKNEYQELYRLIDDFTQKTQELFSQVLREQKLHEEKAADHETPSGETEGEDETCAMCHTPAKV